MVSKKEKLKKGKGMESVASSTYSMRFFEEGIPKYVLREEGMPAKAAYQLIHDELNLDGNATLNLATFNTTWMEPEVRQLIMENLNKNYIDHDEYPQTAEVEKRIINMLARLFNAPEAKSFVGANTVGSSEAILLACLAHKWTWKNRQKAKRRPYDKPNIVMGGDVHTVWDKFARYFDVEPRIVPLKPDRYIVSVKEMEKLIDENTICVGAILGTTFTGQADPIEEINDMLVKIKKKKGWDIPIHVDGASGAFVLPFTNPKLKWDFRLPQVKTINASGHKFGLTYPGCGWLIFRDEKDLPEDIVFHINYLGGEMPSFTLNFSRGSSMLLAQYYNLLRLGKSGYRKILKNVLGNAQYLANKIKTCGRFKMLSTAKVIPVITFQMNEWQGFTVYDLSDKLRERGWIVPAYTLPPDAESVAILRVVVRENF
ncbi:TPA: glutamate decarboxylase, partial [Candidatus Micrarchaeota archaeon]|nr:glutamate decarboxylase [Candidatus Micrarchaeota archaeon]